jgi:predicted nuclease of restriction endonuclease-like (RecB) superfamily
MKRKENNKALSSVTGTDRKSRGRNKPDVIMPTPAPLREMPKKYGEFLSKLKERISRERFKAILSVNSALVLMYWDIGQSILERQHDEGWGAKVIDRLSHDLKTAFPDMSGFSPRNLKYMRKFAESWEVRLWYARKTNENGWSRNILAVQIETRLHERQGKAVNNFPTALPPADSDMAAQIFKDPYIFDFLGTDDPRRETELEQKLVDHIQSFLLELGQGFAFVGRQVHLEIGNDDFYVDLLFYHLRLRCYVIVELKATKFKPGHVSQLNMYLNAVDDLLRHPDDKPSIGLLLVKEKNKMVVEYSLSGYTKPIGVADWERQITRSLPEELKSSLPTIEEIEAELAGTEAGDGE